jgi:hypothetical protein
MIPANMITNMNFPAPLSVLSFLGACALCVLAVLAIVVACFIGKFKLARRVMALIGAVFVIYLALLVCFSVVNRDRVLARGEEKYFCEIDCHLAYSLVDVIAAPTAGGTDYTLTLRTRFDETTTSPQRPKDRRLMPNAREIRLADNSGEMYEATVVGGSALATPLKPGESYLTKLRFLIPAGVHPVRLLITSKGWPEHFLIGDELSPWHGRTWFAL